MCKGYKFEMPPDPTLVLQAFLPFSYGMVSLVASNLTITQ